MNKIRDAIDVPETDCVYQALNHYAARRQGVILLLDTFEQWGSIERWLRTVWLPALSPLIKVCTAGRYALNVEWQRDGWNALVHNVELRPLSAAEMEAYANRRGIDNRDIVDSLQRFSNGMPLALSMASEIIVRKGQTSFLNLPQKNQMIGYLAAELTKGIENASLKRYTEAASVVWRFDQELLQSLLQEHVSAEQFREFCLLPFVIEREDSWSLHDSVRQWTFTDFRNRTPHTFREFRKRALDALREREHASPDQKADMAFEKIYLHDNDFVRFFSFQWDDSLTLRECNKQDLDTIERLYSDFLQSRPNYVPGETHLEPLIRPLWEFDSTAFVGLWKDDRLIAFCSCHALTEQSVRIFRGSPLTAPITAQYEPNGRQYLICLAGTETAVVNEISGSLARAMAKLIDINANIFNLICVPEWSNYLPLLGYERICWADSATPCGVEYRGYQLDLRTESWPSKVDRMFSALSEATSGTQPNVDPCTSAEQSAADAAMPLPEAVKYVQRALKYFTRLPLLPDVTDSLHPLLAHRCPNLETDMIAHRLQDEIQDALRSFADGTAEEFRYYQILYYAYIKKIGTHEIVAEHLKLAVPTYYRYLRTAVHKLAYELTQRPVI